MTVKFKRIAFLFPGQGAQYAGMAQDFVDQFSVAHLTFEEADDLLKRPLSNIVLKGPEEFLTQTKNSQTGIYVTSIAILRVVQELFEITPFVCAGLSLGEYTALTAGEWLSFRNGLPLVQFRGQFMNEACEAVEGTMAVIIGLEAEAVDALVQQINLPNDLWVANYNCPGQIVLSGTLKGIEAGMAAAKAQGAKRVLPLPVHGAFHSGLMGLAQGRLAPYIEEAAIVKGSSQLVMNVPGAFIAEVDQVRAHLIEQVTHSVKWEQGIRAMENAAIDLYLEFGPGKTLSGMNKRIGVQAPTFSIEKAADLEQLAQLLKHGTLA